MYLEERVEQLEHLATDQGRQIETIAKGLAELTTDVRAIRQDMNDGFKRNDEKFERIDQEFAQIKVEFKRIGGRFDEIQQTQQLILKVLNDRL